jgi:integrase
MPRTSKPWYRASSGTWVSRVNGRLRTLAHGRAGKAEAGRRLRDILTHVDSVGEQVDELSVGELAAKYLAWSASNVRPNTLANVRWYLERFVGWKGREHPASAITVMDVLGWAGSKPWGVNTRYTGIGIVKACWAWGLATGLLSENRLATAPKPAASRREVAPTTDEITDALQKLRGHFRTFFLVLVETGARPSELSGATLNDYHPEMRTIVRLVGKTTGKTGKPRVIYLTLDAVKVILGSIGGNEKNRLLLPNRNGLPWDRSSMCKALRRAGVSRNVTPYSVRHWWITEKLRQGVPAAVVAELTGTSVRMLDKHYNHLSSQGDALRAWLERGA